VRVQCKYASRDRGVIVVRLYASRRTATRLRRTLYSPEEVDAFAVYCPGTGRCCFLPMPEFTRQTQLLLRLDETKNHQRAGVKWAKDYEFGATLGNRLGP
jgi:hypothetical protein